MNSKQRWMGGAVLLSGGVLLAALLLKGKEEIQQTDVRSSDLVEQIQQDKTNPATNEVDQVVQLQPLTVDVATEQRLLAEQRRAREKAVAEQEARAAEFLVMQQQAEAEAARRAAEEYAALNAHRTSQQSSDNIPPELIEDEKAKQKRLAEEKAKADASKKAVDKANADRKAEADKKEEEKRKAEEKRKVETDKKAEEKKKVDAEKKTEAEKKEENKKEENKKEEVKPKGQWMVQVALAANQANADAVAAKLRAQGYKVTKSPTSKGIRIMVGPTKTRDGADDLRKKVNTDVGLNMKSAWVIDWVPLDQR